MSDKIYIGVDTGLKNIGVAVISSKGEYLGSVHITTKSGNPISKRLSEIGENFYAFCEQNGGLDIESACLETPLMKNPNDAIKISMATGIMMRVLQNDLNINPDDLKLMSPTYMKKLFTGDGTADKAKIREECLKRIPNTPEELPDHAYDALALAYCWKYIQETGTQSEHIERKWD